MRTLRASVLLVLASMGNAAVTTQPVGTRPAAAPASQPAGLSRYHSLMKNEFMKDADGDIILTPPEIKEAILQIRREALEEKAAIDGRIAALTKSIAQVEQARKTAVAAEKEAKQNARLHARRESRTTIGVDNRGQVFTRREYDAYSASQKRAAKDQAEKHEAKAEAHEDDIARMRVDLVKLKKESAALAAVGSPTSRSIPPKPYWGGLPRETQAQLGRVGITQDEFREVIAKIGLTEAGFIAKAIELDNGIRKTDELVDALRGMFSDRMTAPRKAVPAGRTTEPTRWRTPLTPASRR